MKKILLIMGLIFSHNVSAETSAENEIASIQFKKLDAKSTYIKSVEIDKEYTIKIQHTRSFPMRLRKKPTITVYEKKKALKTKLLGHPNGEKSVLWIWEVQPTYAQDLIYVLLVESVSNPVYSSIEIFSFTEFLSDNHLMEHYYSVGTPSEVEVTISNDALAIDGILKNLNFGETNRLHIPLSDLLE